MVQAPGIKLAGVEPGSGRQAVVFDLPARRFYVFGLAFWPQDFVFLALLLILGGVVGAPIGARLAAKLPGVALRALMSLLILLVAAALLTELLRTPSSLYSLGAREVLP